MTGPRWEPVEHFREVAAQTGVIDAVESIAHREARRWECANSGKAISIPIRMIPSRWLPAGEFPDSAEVVFVEGVDATDLEGIAATVDLRGKAWIALPPGTDASGLVAEDAQLDVMTDAGTQEHRLYRLPEDHTRQRARLAAAPKVGESTDVADERAQWFRKRGGADS